MKRFYLLITYLVLIGLSGCETLPAYKVLSIPLKTDAWSSEWVGAQPADTEVRGSWWLSFDDPVMNQLQSRIEHDNLTLAAALFRYNQANALVMQAKAAQLPNVDFGVSVNRNRQSDNRPLRGTTQPAEFSANTLGATFSYEVDIWGKVRNQVTASKSNALAAAADMENIRLSLHAALADHYVSLRGYDEQLKLFDRTIDSYQRALTLANNRHEGGIASGLDVSRAQTQLSTARAQLTEIKVQRALHLHAIAALLGEPAQEFSLPSNQNNLKYPDIPLVLPSNLLQRRPDIASAERRVAAAHAKVGIAQTAFFPAVGLGTQLGLQNSGGAGWLAAPNSFWTFGPFLALNIFDGGARKSQVNQAMAVLEQTGAEYRATVLTAFQQVEDEISRLRNYKQGMYDQQEAVSSAEKSSLLALSRYRDGAVTYLDVVNAQTVELQTQRDLLNLQSRCLLANIALVRALGGGWQASQVISDNLSLVNKQ